MSQVSKVGAVLFVLTMFVLKAVFAWVIPTLDIIMIGAFIVLVFGPIDISIWLDKFLKR